MTNEETQNVWKPRKQRFTVEECEKCSDDRKFQNGKVVYNQILGMAYSVDEIVEVLNRQGLFSDYFFDLIREKIWYCQLLYKQTGDEKYHIEECCLRILRDESHNRSSIFKYSNFLKESYRNSLKE